ncbi:ribosome small subunit-dependent GTPase A [Symbioplanes lichenis]|uniref:ribosome small subunit-dependent GTPase A n=1 Tax=Symbioplanes lichenis TaxID=1629072 RepID=UPI002738E92C|nr:ribosome small subunit-dependent GTPase A [Actinoplanes lichenis]
MSDLPALGWDATHASAYRRFDRPDTFPGRVLRADRGVCTVYAADGVHRATLAGSLLVTAAADPSDLPCAGDWVVVRRWPDRRTTLEIVLPRRTALVRRTAGKDSSGQVLAANMDLVAVVEPLHPAPDAARIERQLALAWDSGARPLIVLSKSDMSANADAIARQFRAPDVDVLAVSVHRGTGVSALRDRIGTGTIALLGRSGAGKSSLVNALAGTDVMGVQEIRRADGKGRHTTAYRNLVPLPQGGAVLDTPGIRGVGLSDTAEGLDKAFADVAGLAADCRFGDCRHEAEPGCAVQAALADGTLTARRWESWRKLHREVAHEGGRKAVRLAAGGRRRPH